MRTQVSSPNGRWSEDHRFRVASFSQRGSAAFVFRVIPDAPSPEGLGIPDVVLSWAQAQRGLVFVTGPTGAGKSTTSAVLLGLINEQRPCHIITIEDPIEFIHRDRKALISQREIGLDAPSSIEALRGALRQDSDVMLIGEFRDYDTASTAMRAAETGHLVFATMHTNDAGETVQRFIDLFEARHHQLASDARGHSARKRESAARAILGRQPPAQHRGARELGRIRDLIAEGRSTSQVHEAIAEGDYYGMHTFDRDLLAQVQAGRVEYEDALAWATHPHDFKLMVSGNPPTRTLRSTTAV